MECKVFKFHTGKNVDEIENKINGFMCNVIGTRYAVTNITQTIADDILIIIIWYTL